MAPRKRPAARQPAVENPPAASEADQARDEASEPLPAPVRPTAKRRTRKKPTSKAEEENPFAAPPDDDQATVSRMFGWKEPAEAESKGGAGPSAGKDAASDSSSSSSEAAASPCPSAVLGELTQDDGAIEDVLCEVMPQLTRSRWDMWNFPKRNIERLEKHFGEESLALLKENLAQCTLVSLYSGLGD